MSGVQQVLARISRHDDDRYFVHAFVGWLASADPGFVADELDRFEAAERRAKEHVQIDEVPS